MPQPDDDRKKTIEFLKKKFSGYYARAELKFPPELGRREWAFLYFDSKGGMHRPVVFNSEADAKKFLPERSPSHVYYSSAYYEDPAVPMAEKKWQGADLIFDLDADHVAGAEKMSYEEQLRKVKERFIYLVDEFLAKDFVSEKDIEIVFSGGRGYHAHIRGKKILRMTGPERREIVDYITATGIDVSLLFPEKAISVRSFAHHAKKEFTRPMPKPDEPGWKGRAARGILRLVARWEGLEKAAVVGELMEFEGIGKVKAERIYKELFEYQELKGGEITYADEGGRAVTKKMDKIRGVDKLRLENNIEYGETTEDFLKFVFWRLGVSEAAETDEPVTSDVKRIIRMPTSLHGKSGLVVTPLSRKELDAFEPLRDAFPAAFTDSPVKIRVLKPVSIHLKKEYFIFDESVREVPEYAAIFLMCRGSAVPAE